MPSTIVVRTLLGLFSLLAIAAPAAAATGAAGAASATGWAVLCLFGALVGIVLARGTPIDA